MLIVEWSHSPVLFLAWTSFFYHKRSKVICMLGIWMEACSGALLFICRMVKVAWSYCNSGMSDRPKKKLVVVKIPWPFMTSPADLKGNWSLKIRESQSHAGCNICTTLNQNLKMVTVKNVIFLRFDVEWPKGHLRVMYVLPCVLVLHSAYWVLSILLLGSN